MKLFNNEGQNQTDILEYFFSNLTPETYLKKKLQL